MHRSGHDISRKSASALLVVFLIGGLLVPVVHRAHHGQVWAKLHTEAPEACDHTQHSSGFEATIPDFIDDDCLLCVRQLQFDGPHTSLIAFHNISDYVLYQRLVSAVRHVFLLSIRGPPHVA